MRVRPYAPRLRQGDPLVAGLAASYALGRVAPRDLSAWAGPAAFTGSPAPAASPWGACTAFSGLGTDYLECADGPQFDFSGGVTVAALVRFDGGGSYEVATKALDTGAFTGWTLRTNGSNLDWYCYDNGGTLLQYPWTWEVGRWYHLCGTQDRATSRLYIDGAAVGTPVANAVDPTGAAPMRVGYDNAGWSGAAFTGAMAALGVWTRALSAAEVAALAADPFRPVRPRRPRSALVAAASPPLAAGTASLVHSGPGGIALACGLPSGGTAPYATTWRRRVHPAGAWATLANGGAVSGADAATLTDGSAAAGTLYDYLQRATDAASATADSNVVTAQVYTGGAIGGGGTGGPRIGSPFLRGA